jgi:pheromone shutdown protein TraB
VQCEKAAGRVCWSVVLAFQTIREVQPDVVVVELCQYRVSMLKMDERTLLREAKEVSLEKLQQAVRQVRSERAVGT